MVESSLKKCPFKGLTRVKFLEVLVHQENHDLCKNVHVNDVKNLLWLEVRWIFFVKTILYLCLYVSFVMMCVNINNIKFYDNLAVGLTTLFFTVLGTSTELRQFYVNGTGLKERFLVHFGDVWNIMDLLVLMLIYGTTICYWSGVDYQILRFVSSVSLFVSTFDVLYYLRGNDDVSLVVTIMGTYLFEYLVVYVNSDYFVVVFYSGVLRIGYGRFIRRSF
eukprot:UN22761